LVAQATSCTSHARTSALMSGSCGCRRHRVAQEHHELHLAHGQPRADLEVAAQGAAQDAFDVEADFVAQAHARGAGGDQPMAREHGPEFPRQRDHAVLHAVVRDQCDAGGLHRPMLVAPQRTVSEAFMPGW
jgi:hypothetical protein